MLQPFLKVFAGLTLDQMCIRDRKYPLLCRLERSTPEGSVTYVLDKSRLSIRLVPPYSEERLAAARECAKEHGFQVIQTEEKIA